MLSRKNALCRNCLVYSVLLSRCVAIDNLADSPDRDKFYYWYDAMTKVVGDRLIMKD